MGFSNTVKFKDEAQALDDEWEEWRAMDELDYSKFEDLCEKHNLLCRKVVDAYYEDTKEFNSKKEMESSFLRIHPSKGMCAMEPLYEINRCIGFG